MIRIRLEEPADVAAIRELNEMVFGQSAEADLVDALRGAGKITLSLMALENDVIVGYVVFSPVAIETAQAKQPTLALAPLAVTPLLQRRGIGSQLVQTGIEQCRRLGHERVIVVGHQQYYRRFNFVRADKFGLRCEYEVPPE